MMVLNKVQKLPKDWFDLELLEKHLTPEQRERHLKKAGSLEELDENAGRTFTRAA